MSASTKNGKSTYASDMLMAAFQDAMFKNDPVALRSLVDGGFDVNQKSGDGRTPLHMLCDFRNGHDNFSLVSVLIKAGAKVDIKELVTGHTPLMLAVTLGHDRSVDVLLREGQANPNLMSNDGGSALRFAIQMSSNQSVSSKMISALMNHGVNLKMFTDSMGILPLNLAAEHKNDGAIISLLQAGQDPRIMSPHNSLSALEWAEMAGPSYVAAMKPWVDSRLAMEAIESISSPSIRTVP